MIRRRPTQIFSLAFLDCICCGFGAVILIFVLSIDSREKEKLPHLHQYHRPLPVDHSNYPYPCYHGYYRRSHHITNAPCES